ncbi:hypothetical protein AWENTII_001129 [Aspergillus wentii]
MTAPAVGHRPPPNAGPDSTMSLYDHGGPHSDHSPASPRSDSSAIRALHDSASDHPDLSPPPNGLPTTLDMIGIKTEPEDMDVESGAAGSAGDERQNDLRRHSASALLAQLLGNHQSSSSSAPVDQHHLSADQSQGQQQQQPQHQHQPNDFDLDKKNFESNDQSLSNDPTPAGIDVSAALPMAHDQIAISDELPGGLLHDEHRPAGEDHELSFPNPDPDGHGLPHASDLANSLSDPLMLSKDHPDLFASFDIDSSKNPFEALQHNEMLTAAYLSQSADLSALGYSGVCRMQDRSLDPNLVFKRLRNWNSTMDISTAILILLSSGEMYERRERPINGNTRRDRR